MERTLVAEKNSEDELSKERIEVAEFERSGFRDILIGNVEDIVEFLEDAEDKKYSHLDRVVPIDDSFALPTDNFTDLLKGYIRAWMDEVTRDHRLQCREYLYNRFS